MNSKERLARETMILNLMDSFPSLAGRAGKGHIDAFMLAVQSFSSSALEHAVEDFMTGRAPDYDPSYAPTAPQLAKRCATWQTAIDRQARLAETSPRIVSYPIGELPPPGTIPLGPTKLEIDGIMRDTSEWTHEEKEQALRTGHMPTSRDPAKIHAPTPRIKRVE